MKIRFIAAAFVVMFCGGLATGVAAATYQTSGDQYYYAGDPYGEIYCAAYSWSIHTNTGGGNSQGISFILDAKTRKNLYCADPAPAPAGFNNASYEIRAIRNGVHHLCGTRSGVNSAGDWVARAEDTLAVSVLAYMTGDVACSNGSSFYLRFQTKVALFFDWRYYPNSTSYANTPAVWAQN